MKLFYGEYGFLKKNVFKIEGSVGNRKFITTQRKFVEEGFIKCGNVSYCYSIKESKDISAYYVETFCIYKNYKYQIINILENGDVRIVPLQEAQIHFKDSQRHGYDPVYEVHENEISDIWEERTLLEDFRFDVVPIQYIKRDGEFILIDGTN